MGGVGGEHTTVRHSYDTGLSHAHPRLGTMELLPRTQALTHRPSRPGAHPLVLLAALLYGAVELFALQRSRWRAARSR